MAGEFDNMTVKPVGPKPVEYTEDPLKKKVETPAYNNVGGGPSIFTNKLAYTNTNGVNGDNGESSTCFYS